MAFNDDAYTDKLDRLSEESIGEGKDIFASLIVEQVKDRFPLWRYVAIKDNRTRPTHRALDGLIFKQGEGPFPPIDYNCRCTGQFIHISEAAAFTPVSDSDARQLTTENVAVRFDTRGDFTKWLNGKKEGMNGEIKSAVEDSIK